MKITNILESHAAKGVLRSGAQRPLFFFYGSLGDMAITRFRVKLLMMRMEANSRINWMNNA